MTPRETRAAFASKLIRAQPWDPPHSPLDYALKVAIARFRLGADDNGRSPGVDNPIASPATVEQST